ncbi:2-oxoacid:acceptor oxidoreductase, alpha subunit [Archaeoglobus sulfaticallidus PM70-1]|uniref:2-oxoglutarate synthase subunit KorA n=1 Tax=Archaeoglobus sulfaticallidus PM70-1 TaxID=387631 RepID=N0BBG5_9EURY|nr:2-oxoacid:ferredoxin oxidoreductase subunit alpha [Archaeoglobus sulfaticallidus]AGK60348.1 2-oxoacid:acceptor oxidoreductase, alpha subunit [Archaeoglobus sulfaticallidus PM70-1]
MELIIAGAQGSGLESAGTILTRAFALMGYSVLSNREYYSNIKGRHSYIHTKVSENSLSLSLPVDLVAVMDAESVFFHYSDVKEGGYFIYDLSTNDRTLDSIKTMGRKERERTSRKLKELGLDDVESVIDYIGKKVNVVGIDFKKVFLELKSKYSIQPKKASKYVSSILIGSIAGITGLEMSVLEESIKARFKGVLAEHNIFIVEEISDEVRSVFGTPFKLERRQSDERIVANGNEIVAMAKIVAGMDFQSYYPITPAGDESLFLEKHMSNVYQMEDEISAICSAIGSALTGARSSTSTSGPGFSLMVEALGWAGMNEVPVVITYYQRAGPSTGMPTRGSQSDLLFALFASHGEFPRIVIASGDHEEAFYDTISAFNLADKYQLPVIHLLDKHLANSISTISLPDISKIEIDRGLIAESDVESEEGYQRFSFGDTYPVSPRSFIGKSVMWYTGSEHDEFGHVTEDPEFRIRMYEKRMKKLELIDRELDDDFKARVYGEGSDLLLIGWGFTKGACVDAVKDLKEKGISASYLSIKLLSPFPSRLIESVIRDYSEVVLVEENYLAQLGKLISMECGIKIDRTILKFSGRCFYRNEVVEAVERIMRGENRVVVNCGW